MAGSWTQHYDAGVPPSLRPYPLKTLVDYVAENARAAPDGPAILFKGRTITNAQLDAVSDRFAAGLLAEGLTKGDRIALLLPNCPQFLIAEIGAWKAGLSVLPLNPLYTTDELLGPLRSAAPKLVVTLTPFYRRVKELQASTSIARVVATSIKEYLPTHLRVLFTLLKEKKEGHRIQLDAGDVWFQRVLAPAGSLPAPPKAEDPAIMLLSGGTTGTPKAVVGPHRALVAAGLQIATWLQPPPGAKPDVALIPLPLFHVYACVGAQPHAIVGRTPLALVPNPRDLDDVLKTIAQVRPTLFSGVPALFIALLNHPKVKSRSIDFSSIRASFSGAAPLMAATKSQFEALTGGRIVEGYSLTEAMMACVVNPLAGANKVGSVGLPLPDVEVAIVDADTGERVLGHNETGEVIIRAPQLMSGYWGQAEETANILRVHDGDARPWLHTGDLGYLDDDS